MEKEHAEDRPYWATTVHPAKSQGQIIELLENFGAKDMIVSQGHSQGQVAWVIRFKWLGRVYRFVFTPRACRSPDKESSFNSRRRTHADQARYQMGRTAVHFIKAILTAAEEHEGALFGFLELPEAGSHRGGLPLVASEVDMSSLMGDLPPLLEDVIDA
jgi:hypothetical protein